MKLYVVSFFKDSALGAAEIESVFPDRHYALGPRTWLASSPLLTAGDVSKALGIGPSDDRRTTGMVLKASTAYAGFGPRTLWDKLAVWEDAQ